MKVLKVIFGFCLIYNIGFSQSIFQSIYGSGGTNHVGLGNGLRLPDNSIVITGSLLNNILFLKVDSLGIQKSSWTYGDTIFNEVITSSKINFDNKLIVTGYRSNGGISSQDLLISVIDTSGNQDWSIVLGDSLGDSATDAFITADSSYLIVGSTNKYSLNYDRSQGLVCNIDKNGIQKWIKRYGGLCDSCETNFSGLTALGDSTFLVYGSSTQFSNAFERKKLITKIDVNGNILWSRIYFDNCNSSKITKIIVSQNNRLLVLASTCNNDADIQVMEIDTSGLILWSNTYSGATGSADEAFDIVEVESNNFVFSGYASLTKIDSIGNLLWSKSYLWTPFSNFTKSISVNLNQYLAFSLSSTNGINNIYLFSTDTSGVSCNFSGFNFNISQSYVSDSLVNLYQENINFPLQLNLIYQVNSVSLQDSFYCISSVGIDQRNIEGNDLRVSPNPCTDYLTLRIVSESSNLSTVVLEVHNVIGDLVKTASVNLSNNFIELNTKDLKAGLYYITLYQSRSVPLSKMFIKL